MLVVEVVQGMEALPLQLAEQAAVVRQETEQQERITEQQALQILVVAEEAAALMALVHQRAQVAQAVQA